MYSGQVDAPEIFVTTHSGETETRIFNDVVAWPKAEPDFLEPVARFICAKEGNVQLVRLKRGYPPADKEFTCSGF